MGGSPVRGRMSCRRATGDWGESLDGTRGTSVDGEVACVRAGIGMREIGQG